MRRATGHAAVRSSRRAFTLVEVVLVIAILAVLLALVAPSLKGLGRSAKDTLALSNLAQHGKVFSVYTHDYADQWPLPTEPDATQTVFYPFDAPVSVRYFEAHAFWNLALAPQYYDGKPLHPSFRYPGEEAWIGSSYAYSCAFIAESAFWNGATRTGPSQWRSTHAYEVLFPANKALLDTNAPSFLRLSGDGTSLRTVDFLTGFADGSARRVPPGAVVPPYDRGDGGWFGSFHAHGIEMLDTLDGVRGRDAAR